MLEIRQYDIYRGPNIWSRKPVIHLEVHLGELEERPTNLIPGFNHELISLIPSLQAQSCPGSESGGFIQRLQHGTWMGHVLQHVALELQTLAGTEALRGKTRGTERHGVYNVLYEYRQADVGIQAGQIACRLLNHLIYSTEPEFSVPEELKRLILLAERLSYGPTTQTIVQEAERRGIPVLRLDPRRSLVQLGHGCHQKRIWTSLTSSTSDIAASIAHDKELTNQLLRRAGITSPQGEVVSTVEEAIRAAARIGYPVVAKPIDGNHGRGVVTNIIDEPGVRHAFTIAAETANGKVLIERFFAGKDYRILVIGGKVVAVAERVPAHIIGNGNHTITELVEQANADPDRGIGHEKILTRIKLDHQSETLLAEQDLTATDIPAIGQFVQLKQTGNLSTGGTSIDRTDEIHPQNSEIARHAAKVIGLDIAGIDFITSDISQPARQTGGGVVEVNAGPGFRMHTHPTYGQSRPVGREVVGTMFPAGARSRIPIVAVTGTNGKTTTARMTAHIVRASGLTVGLTTTDGIYISDERIATGDMAGPQSAQIVLQDPRVEFAVLEAARGGILRSGLGFDYCNVAIVTNVTSDHLGLRGAATMADLARAKGVVPSSVFRDGTSVLNADNPWTVRVANDARGNITFFSMNEGNPIVQEHLRDQGRAVIMRQTETGDALVLLEREMETHITFAHEIPATLGGRIRVNIANALAASAAALAVGVPVVTIREALATFTNDFTQTPGRFNHISINGCDVLLDYAHNVGALQAIGDVVKSFNAPRSIGMIAIPGDRRDEDARAFGELAARTFDRIVIWEESKLRERKTGEMPGLLREAVLKAGLPADCVSIVPNEMEAVSTAVQLGRPGDLVVVLVGRVEMAWNVLQAHASSPEPGVIENVGGLAPAPDALSRDFVRL
ncbi:MAG: cyanophycin synthetase [Thermomicrobiales bacterium]